MQLDALRRRRHCQELVRIAGRRRLCACCSISSSWVLSGHGILIPVIVAAELEDRCLSGLRRPRLRLNGCSAVRRRSVPCCCRALLRAMSRLNRRWGMPHCRGRLRLLTGCCADGGCVLFALLELVAGLLSSCEGAITAAVDACALRHAAMRLLWLMLWDLGRGASAGAALLGPAGPLTAELARSPGRPANFSARHPAAGDASVLAAMLHGACVAANANVCALWSRRHVVMCAVRRPGRGRPSVPAVSRQGSLLGVLRWVPGVGEPRRSVGWRRQVPLRRACRCRCRLLLRLADLVILDDGVQGLEILRSTTI